MANRSKVASRFGLTVLGSILLTIIAAGTLAYYILGDHPPLAGYQDRFASGDMADWTAYGGSWAVRDGALRNLTAGRGDKVVVGNRHWTDYEVRSDLRLDSDPHGLHWGDAGVIVRAKNPNLGVDSYDGYYIGLSYEDRLLFIGRAAYAWNRLASAHVEAPIHLGEFYRLTVRAKGCNIDAMLQSADNLRGTAVSYYDENCQHKAGAAGVRTFGIQASWKDFQVLRLE